MNRLAPLILILSALFLASCSSNDTEAAVEPPEEATASPTEESEPQDSENVRTPPDMDNLTAEEHAVLNARPDHELYDRYSDEAFIEDARHTCRHIEINVKHGNTIALHTLDQIHTNNQISQNKRVDSPDYPDDTPYISDMEYPVEQALIHMCPELLDEVEREAFDTISEFTKAGHETGYLRFTDDGYEFTN